MKISDSFTIYQDEIRYAGNTVQWVLRSDGWNELPAEMTIHDFYLWMRKEGKDAGQAAWQGTKGNAI